jgi:hypothetical protein
MAIKYTKCPININQIAVKYTYQMAVYIQNGHKLCEPFPFRDPPKFTKIFFFGLKIYHLATLVVTALSQQQKPF